MGNCLGSDDLSSKSNTDVDHTGKRDAPLKTEDSTSGKAFSEIYDLKKKLGEGAFSVVKEAAHKKTKVSYAIKIVTKAKLTEDDEEALKDEISILKDFDNQHVIRLYDVFNENLYYYLVTERMMGGELFDRVVKKAYYNEKEARDVCKILFMAIEYCHSKQVAHRDLKPENLLLVSNDDDSQLKIADFGFAKKVTSESCLTTQCGTPGYVAPEILENVAYGTKSDMWSLGVITYILLGGYPPFIEKNQRNLFRKIRQGDYKFHDEYWGNVSHDAKDLIKKLLTVDPSKRLSAKEALQTKWMIGDDTLLSKVDLGANQQKLKEFNAERTFKKAVHAVITIAKLESLGTNYRDDLK